VALKLSEERRSLLVRNLQALFRDTFDEELSEFRAGQILDFALAELGPSIYNQAVQDARAYFQRKLDDLEGEVYETEVP
jgi:uncharacterized protein (DUF2164 family)